SMAKAAQDASPLRDCLAAFESAAQAASSQGDPGARRRRRVLRRYGGI
ncbi:MAG: TetR/AcrR family transcriptional regulator, partial [Mesorhizobium sp.]